MFHLDLVSFNADLLAEPNLVGEDEQHAGLTDPDAVPAVQGFGHGAR